MGEPSIEKLKNSISAQEFLDWQTYFSRYLTMRDFTNICQANICRYVRHAFSGKKLEEIEAFIIDVDDFIDKDDDELSEIYQRKANNATEIMRMAFKNIVAKQATNE